MDAATHARRIILAKAEDFYPQLVSALERHGGQGLWVHFSDIPKVGIQPDSAPFVNTFLVEKEVFQGRT